MRQRTLTSQDEPASEARPILTLALARFRGTGCSQCPEHSSWSSKDMETGESMAQHREGARESQVSVLALAGWSKTLAKYFTERGFIVSV